MNVFEIKSMRKLCFDNLAIICDEVLTLANDKTLVQIHDR